MQRGPCFGYGSPRTGQIGDGAAPGRFGTFQFGLGRYLAAGEFGHLAQTVEIGAGFAEGGVRLGNRGFGGIHGGFRFGDRVAQLGSIQAGDDLALCHPVVFVGQHGFERSGQFAADVDRARRLQRTAGRDADHEFAHCGFFGQVAAARTVASGGEQADSRNGTDGRGEQYPALFPAGKLGWGTGFQEVGSV